MNIVKINVATLDDIRADLAAGRYEGQAVYSFPTLKLLRATLTPTRIALLSALAGQGTVTMRQAAQLAGRDYRSVHADITALLGVGVLDRRSRGIVFPYDGFEIEPLAFSYGL
ncbi:MAG: DNA-binding protein [Pigmentiphaga sp.]